MSGLRLLLVEGSPDDALLIARELVHTWPDLDWRRVESPAELEAALGEEWDAVVADSTLPQLDALEALRLVRGRGFDGPFVVVSGTDDEEAAVAAMRAGAHDYVPKGSLRRLAPALERELAGARLRAGGREAEARFRALIESSLDVTTILLADGTIRYASPSAERVLGYAPESLLDRNAFDLVHPEDVPALGEIFRRAAASPGASETDAFRARHRDGGWRLMEAVGLNLLADPAVRGMVVTARDITARRALEERVSQSERLDAIGQLAGGVAHDFNNVLLVIRGYCSVLRASLTDERQVADVEEIATAADRAANLTRQLLAFGRRQVLQPRVLAVPDVVRDLESLLRRAVPERIELVLELDETMPPVLADPSQVEQVLVNLVLNARDATGDGGTIELRTGSASLADPDDAPTPPLPAGEYATLTVRDTGCGIPEEALPHVFEPFFTTKGEGLGTGLGLSTVYGVVTQSGGSVGIRTSEGEGTEITLFLPAAAEEAAAESGDAGDDGGAGAGGSESILLVEDEEPVRELVRRVLQEAGYRVHASALPRDALGVLEGGGRFDLLISDVVMPQMSGYELAAQVSREHPGMRTLFISGYEHEAARAGEGVEERVLLPKPFSPGQLARAVRGVLDGATAAGVA